jgi:hypothetical protein
VFGLDSRSAGSGPGWWCSPAPRLVLSGGLQSRPFDRPRRGRHRSDVAQCGFHRLRRQRCAIVEAHPRLKLERQVRGLICCHEVASPGRPCPLGSARTRVSTTPSSVSANASSVSIAKPALGPNSTATVSRPSVPDDPVVVLCLLAHPSVPRAGTTPWRARQAHPSVGLSQGLLLRGPRPHHVSTFPRPKLR